MQEDVLQFIWKYQHFDRNRLQTNEGEELLIFENGIQNFESGPDFSGARIKIGDITWNGNVEIHVRSSEWNQHNHHKDPAYNNVILHVVLEDNLEVHRQDGTQMPVLVLKNRISNDLLGQYYDLMSASEDIVCSTRLNKLDQLVKIGMIEKALISRLEAKAIIAHEIVESCLQDWDEAAYQLLVSNFGFKANESAFKRLGKVLPLKVLLKNRDNLLQMEALLFGQAGFLAGRTSDGYVENLKSEFIYLKHKYALEDSVINNTAWKFGRLRPPNFPTIRIAQLAAAIFSMKNIFSTMVQTDSIQTLRQLLSTPPSKYWENHYRFGENTQAKSANLGKSSADLLIINTTIPLLVAYSSFTGEQVYLDRAISLLQMIPPEANRIISSWEKVGIQPASAADSQGMIELFNSYCLAKRCLSCNIGTNILNHALASDG